MYTKEESEKDMCKYPEYYVNKNSGDLFIIWWTRNRPSKKDGWIRINRLLYKAIFFIRRRIIRK